MPHHVLRLYQELPDQNKINKVVMLGVSYKANVGDERNSPGLQLTSLIKELGKNAFLHDPYIKKYDCDLENLLSGADVLILVTDHDIYLKKLKPDSVAKLMKRPLIIDTREFFSSTWDKYFDVIRLGVGIKKNLTVS